MTKKVGKTEAPPFEWVQQGKEALAREILGSGMLPALENEVDDRAQVGEDGTVTLQVSGVKPAEQMSRMKAVEFVVGEKGNYYFEAAVKDGILIIHLFPKDLAVGFPEKMGEIIRQVYWELLEGRTDRLEVGFTPMATPSWIDVEDFTRRGKDIPAYPSWNIELYGYGDLPHTHELVVNRALELLDERMSR